VVVEPTAGAAVNTAVGTTVITALTGAPAHPTLLLVYVGVTLYEAVPTTVPALNVAARGFEEVQPDEQVIPLP
jgi:hypothetical protein